MEQNNGPVRVVLEVAKGDAVQNPLCKMFYEKMGSRFLKQLTEDSEPKIVRPSTKVKRARRMTNGNTVRSQLLRK